MQNNAFHVLPSWLIVCRFECNFGSRSAAWRRLPARQFRRLPNDLAGTKVRHLASILPINTDAILAGSSC
jgi:hypothetical protein